MSKISEKRTIKARPKIKRFSADQSGDSADVDLIFRAGSRREPTVYRSGCEDAFVVIGGIVANWEQGRGAFWFPRSHSLTAKCMATARVLPCGSSYYSAIATKTAPVKVAFRSFFSSCFC